MDDKVEKRDKVTIKSVENPATRDPIPETFSSIEEMAEFWDTHDTTDYEDCFGEEVELEISPLAKSEYHFAIDKELIEQLRPVARKRGISLETLINLMLSRALPEASHEAVD